MATTQAARTDTIIIVVDGDELKLSVTTRAPIPEQPNPPTESQLARIRTGCVMQYTTNYRKAISGEWAMDTFDADLKSPIRYVAENSEDNQQIQPSIADPYVTVWQMGNWGSNNPPSLTLHDYDSGNTILQLSAICEASNDKLREVFNTGSGIKGMQLLYISSFKRFPQEHSNDSVNPPTPENTNRIGQHADSLPDTVPMIESSGLRPAMLAPTGSQGDIMFASGKGDTAWKFALWATKKIDYNNRYALQYGKDEIRAYPLTSVEIKDVNGSVVASVKTQLGNIDIWKKKKDSDENSIDWQRFQEAMVQIGILAPQLIPKFKKSFDAIVLFTIANSEDGTKEYKNFYDFRAMPQNAKTIKPHEDLNTFFGAKEAPTDDIPF